MKEKIKKYDNIIVTIIFILISICSTLMQPIIIGDELWNFQNVYKMINGYTIYQDANVIITPIFYIIGKWMLKIFGANLLIFRIYNIIIYVFLMLIIYQILKTLKIKKREAFLYTLIIHYALYRLIGGGANYNLLAMIWVSLGTYISLKILNQKKYNILNGIIIYLTFFTKQNIGVYYIIGTILLQFFINGINKKSIKNLIKQATTFIILVTTSILIMHINGNLNDFINYCFLGIGEFTNNLAIDTIPILYLVLAGIIVTFSIIQVKILKNNIQEKNNIITLLSLGIPMIFIAIPIANEYHVLIGMLILFILLIYILHISIIKEFITTKITNWAIAIMIMIFVFLSIKVVYKNIQNLNLQTDFENPYYGAVITETTKEKIEKINNHIKEKKEKAIIFSQDSALYNIPEKRNNGAMDLPFLGNMGKGGEDEMLEKIQKLHEYEILIKEPLFWQESTKINEYIKNNYEKTGEIEEFQIYYIP